MAVTTCKYHPKIPARWECYDCNISICSDCIKKDVRLNQALCPLCNGKLEQISASNFIVPFWQRIPKFFLYPANLTSLLFIIFVALGTTFIPFHLGQIVLALIFMRYALTVLEHSADGHLEPPDIKMEEFFGDISLPIKQILVFAAMGFLVVWIGAALGGLFATIATIFLLIGIPASTMILAIDHSFFRALNPVTIAGIMTKIGLPYLVLYFFLLTLYGGNGALTSLLAHSSSTLLFLIQTIAGYYFTLIIYNMMGYVIFQYHEELGYHVNTDVDRDFESQVNTQPGSRLGVPNEIDVLIKEGRIEDAANRLRQNLAQDVNNIELHEQYHKFLLQTRNIEPLIKHGQEFINFLLYENKISKAATIYKDCWKFSKQINKEISIADPSKIPDMATTLMAMRAFREAFGLMNGFHKRYPNHPQIPHVFLLTAKLLCEEFNQEQRAMQIITFLQKKYPNHELRPAFDQYATFLNNLMAQGN